MPASIFFLLMTLSLAGAACSFFFHGFVFAAVLSASLLFPAASFLKGMFVIVRRRMIMRFVAEEIEGIAAQATRNVGGKHARAVKAMRTRAISDSRG